MKRADSLNKYIADVNAGMDTVIAWRNHKARVGELASYEATLTRNERNSELRKAERINMGCAA